MIIEAAYHALSLDIGWFVQLIFDNVLWVFIFFVAANILDESKTFLGSIALFLFFAFDLFAELSFASVSGWYFLGAGFLGLLYLSRTALSIWVENSKSLQKHTLKILTLHWLVVYAAFNIFVT